MVVRKTQVFKRARKEGIDLTTIEPNFPDKNYGGNIVCKAELEASKIMDRKLVPLPLWCYALEYYCDVSTLTVSGIFKNKIRAGYDILFRNTLDISEYVEFKFY